MTNLIIPLLICIGLLTGCNVAEMPPDNNPPITTAKAEYRKISAEQAYRMMAELTDYTLLDVRTDEEFKEKRIDGAVLMPDYAIKNRAKKDLTDKNTVILIYCRSGNRSANAARELIGMGYKHVYDFGGIIDWQYDTVSD